MPICMYCCKPFSEEHLFHLRNDFDPKKRLQYCERCLPEVEKNIRKTPWLQPANSSVDQEESKKKFNDKFAKIIRDAKNR